MAFRRQTVKVEYFEKAKDKEINVRKKEYERVSVNELTDDYVYRNLDETVKSVLYKGDELIWYRSDLKKVVIGKVMKATRSYVVVSGFPVKLRNGVKKGGYVWPYYEKSGMVRSHLANNTYRLYEPELEYTFEPRSFIQVMNKVDLQNVSDEQILGIYKILGIEIDDIIYHKLPLDSSLETDELKLRELKYMNEQAYKEKRAEITKLMIEEKRILGQKVSEIIKKQE